MTDIRKAAQAARDLLADMPIPDGYYTASMEVDAMLRAALAQPEQQPPQKERPDFIAGYSAGLADGRRIAERDRAEQSQPEQQENCDE